MNPLSDEYDTTRVNQKLNILVRNYSFPPQIAAGWSGGGSLLPWNLLPSLQDSNDNSRDGQLLSDGEELYLSRGSRQTDW